MANAPLKIVLNSPQTYQIGMTPTQTYQIGMTTPVAYGAAKLSIDTSANWAERTSYIPKKGEIIVYSDWKTFGGSDFPGIKIGDGATAVNDLLFSNTALYSDLPDKPQINGVTLSGNLKFNDLFPDGLIIDGGTAEEVTV